MLAESHGEMPFGTKVKFCKDSKGRHYGQETGGNSLAWPLKLCLAQGFGAILFRLTIAEGTGQADCSMSVSSHNERIDMGKKDKHSKFLPELRLRAASKPPKRAFGNN